MVFLIKNWFFTGIKNFNLKQKPHILYFFALFCSKIIDVICIMLAIIIKDFKLYINNKNLLIKKLQFVLSLAFKNN